MKKEVLLFIRYSKIGINIYAFVLTTIFSVVINQLIIRVDKNEIGSINVESKENAIIYEENVATNNLIDTSNKVSFIYDYDNESEIDENNLWQIEIPKIGLTAPIAEGTSLDILNSYVGHFEETSDIEGNVGLAGHNRGYPINYFQNVKELNIEDIIVYNYYGEKKVYVINAIAIIKDTDWSYLQETEDNRITLITCVENMPEFRRCVQGIEKFE